MHSRICRAFALNHIRCTFSLHSMIDAYGHIPIDTVAKCHMAKVEQIIHRLPSLCAT